MQLGRKLAEGYAADPEADALDAPPPVTTEERTEQPAEPQPVRV